MLSVRAVQGCILQNERVNWQWGRPGIEKIYIKPRRESERIPSMMV